MLDVQAPSLESIVSRCADTSDLSPLVAQLLEVATAMTTDDHPADVASVVADLRTLALGRVPNTTAETQARAAGLISHLTPTTQKD